MAVRSRRLPLWVLDAERIDAAVYSAVLTTSTPALDAAMRTLTRVADRSQLWIGTAALLAVGAGPRGRRAARAGLTSIAVSSVVANLVLKPVGRRRRPDRDAIGAVAERAVQMPASRSFPSGHAASAFAFATAVGTVMPREGVLLRALAGLVAYSRVHTGVHFPGDVIAGAFLGMTLATATTRVRSAA